MERRPRCCGFYVKRLLVQIIHTKSKAATDVFRFNRGHAAGMLEGFKEILGVITAARPASSWTPEEIKIMKEKAEQIEQESAGNSGLTMAQLEATVSAFYDVPEYARLLG